jgi:hypothetical protein
MRELFERFGGGHLAARLEHSSIFEGLGATGTGNVKDLDDFSACGIEHPEDIRWLSRLSCSAARFLLLSPVLRNQFCGAG